MKEHLHRCYMHIVRKEETHSHHCHRLGSASAGFLWWWHVAPNPSAVVSIQTIAYTELASFLSVPFSLSLSLSFFLTFLQSALCLSFPGTSVLSDKLSVPSVGAAKQLSEKFAPTRYIRLLVSDRRLTATCPGLDSWHGRRTPVPVQASVFRLLLCLYTKKGTQMFSIAYNAGLSLGRHAYASYHAFTFWYFRGQSWNNLCSSSFPVYHDPTLICKELWAGSVESMIEGPFIISYCY